MDWQPPTAPNPHRNRRWGLKLALAAVVVLVVAGVALLVPRWFKEAAAPVPASVAIPGEVLLPAMRSQPVVGWRLDLTALIPDTNQPLQAEMFGNIGDRTFFTVTGDDDGQRAWVVGVDGEQGSPLFAPVEIGGYRSAKCFVNGPERG